MGPWDPVSGGPEIFQERVLLVNPEGGGTGVEETKPSSPAYPVCRLLPALAALPRPVIAFLAFQAGRSGRASSFK